MPDDNPQPVTVAKPDWSWGQAMDSWICGFGGWTEHHDAENRLMLLFWTCCGFMVYFNHTHNDELGKWATIAASNILSCLFGLMKGKSTP